MERKKEFYEQFRNKRQGRILIRDVVRMEKKVGRIWSCVCDCGKEFEVPTYRIASGGCTECPECAKRHNLEKASRSLRTHGLGNKKNRIYREWCAMNRRCTCPSDTGYKFYGAKGISVCSEWSNSFPAFYDWAMQNGYTDNLTIDRIDGNGNYSPQNCRWVPKRVQMVNRKHTRLISVNGVTMSVADWARATGLNRIVLTRHSDSYIEDRVRKNFPTEFHGEEWEIKGQKVFVWDMEVTR